MKILICLSPFLLCATPIAAGAQESFQSDTYQTGNRTLEITFIGHGTLMLTWGEVVVHVDPVGREADYTKLPEADLIVVTHEHGDHLDADVIQTISKEGTKLVYTALCAEKVPGGTVMANDDRREECGIGVEAVPAYNLVHMRRGGTPYHPKGNGNGYVLTFGDLRVYVAGDTENTPEMKALEDIDIAFLPMNLPYTMTPEMVADAARAFRPRILYPYHYGNTDPEELVRLLQNAPDIEVRIRDLK
jgi:L-ascorbate metabolism protein UlaG (beta-lactamase superfamily)